jgi:hypothetical protein
MVYKLKRLPTEWENIFASYTSDEGLINNQNIHRAQKTKLPAKINDPMKKWANVLNKAFSKEEVQMAKNHVKKIFNIPDHKGNANKNHVKIRPHSCWNGYHSNTMIEHKQQTLVRLWGKRNPHTLLVGI